LLIVAAALGALLLQCRSSLPVSALTLNALAVTGAATMARATPAGALADEADVVGVGPGAVRFCFASASATLASGAADALADVVRGVAAGQKAAIRAWYDEASGNQAQSLALARQRALAVRGALAALGVGDDRVALGEPGQVAAASADARCVEVALE
jgi:K(+)-stimulated pyrophosphate-energized sodium pump